MATKMRWMAAAGGLLAMLRARTAGAGVTRDYQPDCQTGSQGR
jgi:hypothetical protein